jgi:hypothetical protein
MRSTLLAIAAGSAIALRAGRAQPPTCYGQRLVRRIGAFNRHVQAIADGDYAAPLPSSRALELENLAEHAPHGQRHPRARGDWPPPRSAIAPCSATHHWPISRSTSLTAGWSRSMTPGWPARLPPPRWSADQITDFLSTSRIAGLAEVFPAFVANGQIDDLCCEFHHKDGEGHHGPDQRPHPPGSAWPGAHPLHPHRHQRAQRRTRQRGNARHRCWNIRPNALWPCSICPRQPSRMSEASSSSMAWRRSRD